jgi:4-hydroxybutyrate dehydrogenase
MTASLPPVSSPMLQLPRIQLAHGAIRMLPAELAHLGVSRPLFLTDQGLVKAGVFDRVRAAMPNASELVVFDEIPENPTVAGVEAALAMYRARGCDAVIAVGGGSVLDSGKATAVMATHPGQLPEYFRKPEKIGPNVAKLVAIPTTSGTGSEVSRGAGIHATSTSRGEGINGPYIVPKLAICDPELTFSLPKHLTAATGMDALSHAVENYLAKGNNPLGDAIALDSIRRVFTWLPRAVANGQDADARYHMMLASMEAMMPCKGLGAGHALANTFGDQGLHHGTLVTLALPAVLRRLDKHVGDKLKHMAEAMGLEKGRHAAAGIADFNERFGLPATMKKYGYKVTNLDELVDDAHKSWFNHTAPYHFTAAEYREVIEEILG